MVAGGSIDRGRTRARRVIRVAALVAFAQLAALVALTSRAADPAVAMVRPELHDTIWELPIRATSTEANVYFSYLANAGYDGAWMSLFAGAAASPGTPNRNGHGPFTIDGDGDFVVNAAYLADTRALLDIAHSYGLRITLAPIWGNAHIHQSAGCAGVNQGVLNADSAFSVGQQVAVALGDHPALANWLYGGDNYCAQGTPEDVDIWRNLDLGIIAGGGGAVPVGYHAPNGGDVWFKDEPWLDFHAVQTSHCTQDDELAAEFAWIKSQTSKPVWAAEMRYEAMEPTFCTRPDDPGPGNPVTANNVLNDATAAFNAGLPGVVYGHNERWQWGMGGHASTGNGWTSVQASFNAPGEALMLALWATGTPPPTTTTTTSTTTTTTVATTTTTAAPAPTTTVRVSNRRAITVGYDAADASDLTWAAGYLDTTPEELQRSGQFVARFITALGGGLDTPNPIAPQFRPSTTGPVQFTSSWPAAEEEVLDWTMSHYGLDARQAHVLGASMLTFLAGVDAAQRGIPR